MKMKLFAAVALAAVSGISIAQTGGGRTAAGTGATPSTSATPATPATPADHGLSGAPGSTEMESARQACAKLAGAEARQACVRQHSQTGSRSMHDGSRHGGDGMSNRGSDTSVSPGTGSGGGEDGRSKGGAGFPKGTTPSTDGGNNSGGRSGSGRTDQGS